MLGLVLGVGGLRKLIQAWRARAQAIRLESGDATVDEIESGASAGRAAIPPLFGLLSGSDEPPKREAAGRALARLWADDEMIGEEEQAMVRRGFEVRWMARRTYPRNLRRSIPIAVAYGVPFLEDERSAIRASDLEWSHRVAGTGRAGLEVDSPWQPGPARLCFTIEPGDFPSNGPHRLVLQARVRTGQKLTSTWEIALPHMPFAFEFDPRLQVEALLTHHDAARAEEIERLISLATLPDGPTGPELIPLCGDLVLRNPVGLALVGALPADLAHRVEIEIEGMPSAMPAGEVVLAAGTVPSGCVPIRPLGGLPAGAIEMPGPRRVRCRLIPDAELGWASPSIRSVWPGTIVTPWATVSVVRR